MNNELPAQGLGKARAARRQLLSCKSGSSPSILVQIFIIVTILAAITVAVFHNTREYCEITQLATEQFNQQQLILARSTTAGIKTFIADIDDDVRVLSEFPVVQNMEPGTLERMEVLYKGISPQTSSRRLDKNGILRFVCPNEGWRKKLVGRDYSGEAFFQKTKETGKTIISDLIINEDEERRIRVVRPVYVEDEERGKEFNGVIICSFDPDTLSSLYISSIVSGETGYAWLLNEDGIFLAHHEKEFLGQDAFKARAKMNSELSYNLIDNIQRQMLAGEEGVGRYVSGWHRGQTGEIEKLIAYTPVHVFDKLWSVAVCAPVYEVKRITSKIYYSGLYAMGFIILVLTAGGVFLFIAFHRWTWSLKQEIKTRIQAEQALQKAHDELEIRVEERIAELQAVNKELEAFCYSASHDLRAPLRAIDGFSKILLEDYLDALDKQGEHYLQRVRADAQNMGQLIDGLSNLFHITRRPINKKMINLETIAKEAYESLKNEWKHKKVNFTLHQCPPVLADPHLMQIVFFNLLSNALKFTRKRAIAEIEVGSEVKDKQRVFFVKDNGIGFDMKYADKIFVSFQRLHRAEEYEGAGIGLATVQRIIHRHSGRIWVESRSDSGTTFYFYFTGK